MEMAKWKCSMLIKHCPILKKINNNALKNALILYLKSNPCCEQFKTNIPLPESS